jgi:hypothetical protein
LGVDEVDENAYIATLMGACRALERRAVQPPVDRIEVLRRDGAAGWLFEQAERCPEVLRAPKRRLAITVAAASRPIGPKPP